MENTTQEYTDVKPEFMKLMEETINTHFWKMINYDAIVMLTAICPDYDNEDAELFFICSNGMPLRFEYEAFKKELRPLDNKNKEAISEFEPMIKSFLSYITVE